MNCERLLGVASDAASLIQIQMRVVAGLTGLAGSCSHLKWLSHEANKETHSVC